ncbi:MAG: hypothetical protein K2N06_05580 [Oscillospiraceae bacterium]|nr:hypothetical protein [Oscillospiraceae bacterium]
MAYGNYGGVAYPAPNYYNGYNGVVTDQGNRFAGQYQQNANFPLQAPAAPMPMQQSSNGIIWVQGEEGAKAYMVAPGNSVQLWDSENPVIYLKSADMNGVPSMRIFDLVERNATRMPQNVPIDAKFVTQEQMDALQAKFDALETRFNSLSTKPAKLTKSKEEIDNG